MFKDRAEAGRLLGQLIEPSHELNQAVFGLPRGGVPVAFEVAKQLEAPLGVVAVKKVGTPFNPELALGAATEEAISFANGYVLEQLGVSAREFELLAAGLAPAIEQMIQRFRGGKALPSLQRTEAILIDDGFATGATAAAGARLLRHKGAARVVLAAPVGAPETILTLRREADEVVCIETPRRMQAVGMWYEDFSQTSDEEVLGLLTAARN